MSRAEHWENVYRTKGPDQVSWFQAEARLSRQLIETLCPERTRAIIDIGAGASTLVDGLLDSGYLALTVLDLSPAALQVAQARLGGRADAVSWQAADILDAELPEQAFDVWHDRAVFHFLTAFEDRRRYVEQVSRAVRPGGIVVVATETSQPGSFRVSTIFFPLPQHRNAVRAANAAFCAHEQGRLNAMTEALYANRGRWSSRSELVIAREAGVADEATFLRCMSQADTFPSVRAGIQAANRLGLTGTPSLVLNGKLLTNISSARALEDYLLDEARAFTRR